MNVYAPTSSEVIAFRHEWTPHGVCEIGAGDGTWLAALNQGGIDAIAACFFEIAILNDRAAAGPRCTGRCPRIIPHRFVRRELGAGSCGWQNDGDQPAEFVVDHGRE